MNATTWYNVVTLCLLFDWNCALRKANLMKDPNCATVLCLPALRMSNLFNFQLFRTEIEIPWNTQQTYYFLRKSCGVKSLQGHQNGYGKQPFLRSQVSQGCADSICTKCTMHYTISLCYAFVLRDSILGAHLFGSNFPNGSSSFQILLSRQEMTKRFSTRSTRLRLRTSEDRWITNLLVASQCYTSWMFDI